MRLVELVSLRKSFVITVNAPGLAVESAGGKGGICLIHENIVDLFSHMELYMMYLGT